MTRTLLTYWDVLTSKDRQLIHDLLRANHSARSNLQMGVLPFIPVKEVIDLLRTNPLSPWSTAVYHSDPDGRWDENSRAGGTQYDKSRQVDAKMYQRLITTLTQTPSKLAEQLRQWEQQKDERPYD